MKEKLGPPEPTAIVIFGASGDLAHRKLLPALFHLFAEGLLPASFAIIGYARSEMTDQEFIGMAREAVGEYGRTKPDDETWGEFAEGLSYVSGGFTEPGAFTPLREHLESLDRTRGTEGRRFYYCAVPPEAFDDVASRIREEGMGQRASIVIEKPFGSDLDSARELNRMVHRAFDESQVFRIDHYLGKETVQNILVLRFANALFEPVWNHHYVDHVQLTVAENIGIEGRGRFYERTGAIRDMVQTHLFQVLTFLTMEPPTAFEPDALRDEIGKVLRAMRPVPADEMVRGQYRGYRQEDDVASDSQVETFVALRAELDNWRWAGVPFFLRTGKRLPRKISEATVVFRDVPHQIFEQAGIAGVAPNRLTLRIQPNEGISLSFMVQRPGLGIRLDGASLDFDYGETFSGRQLVEAYEHLLLEAMHGDHTLFLHQEVVERAWELLDPVVDSPPPVHKYEQGSWGPQEADALIAPRRWLTT